MTDYIKIDWPEVRADDVLMHENGDRLTVQGFERVQIRTTAGLYTPSEYRGSGFTPYRKRPGLPTADGTYVSREDWGRRRPSAVTLYSHQPGASAGPEWEWTRSEADGWVKVDRADLPDDLVRLVPMPTEEQVYKAIERVTVKQFASELQHAAAAVMALLEGESDD